jgi:uncharacterized protein
VKVNVARLRRTEGSSERYEFHEKFPSLQFGNEEYLFQTPLDVQIDVVNTGKSLLVNGKISAVITVNCSRCLGEFPFHLNFDFEDEWLPRELAELDSEGNALIFEKDEFCIDDRIFEQIFLHLPMRFICSETCRGLCPKCGADLNKGACACTGEDVDPRLAILSKWNKGV